MQEALRVHARRSEAFSLCRGDALVLRSGLIEDRSARARVRTLAASGSPRTRFLRTTPPKTTATYGGLHGCHPRIPHRGTDRDGVRRHTPVRKSTETKAAFKTTELMVFVGMVITVLVAALIVDENDAGSSGSSA